MLQLQFVVLPILAAVFTIPGLVLWLLWFRLRRDTGRWRSIGDRDWDHQPLLWTGAPMAIVGGIFIIAFVLTAIPFNSAYWYITHPSGTVASSSFEPGQLVVDGKSGTVYVMSLAGDENQYIVNDDRATALRKGDHINLACTLQWRYGGKDQYNCVLAN